MKFLLTAILFVLTILPNPSYAADAPYEIVVIEATFDGVKPLTLVTRYGEKGEIAVGKKKEFDFGHVFFGRRLRIEEDIDADLKSNDVMIQLVYEELEEPTLSKESGVISQPSKKIALVVNLDG